MTPWTITCQAPLSVEFSRQEYWNRLPFPTPEDLPNPGIECKSPALHVDSLLSEPPGKPCPLQSHIAIGLPRWHGCKESACQFSDSGSERDSGSTPGSGRFLGVRNG